MFNKRLDSLQAGRALAALAVVAHHSVAASRDFGGFYIGLFEWGWLGVDFFFVLSGFIIALSIDGKILTDYAWHRVRRVFLPYLPIGIGIAILYVALPTASAANRDWSWLTSLTLVPFGAPALSVAWTLQHEALFYTMFALAWFSKRMWLLGVWGGLCLIPNGSIVFKTINIEFLAGVLCFHATRAGIRSYWLLPAALLLLAAWIITGCRHDASVLVGISIAIAIPFFVHAEHRGLKVPDTLVFLGNASYSIYLAHGLAISIAVRFNANMLFCVAAGVSGGLLYYFAVERVILKFVSRDLNATPRKSQTV